MEKEKLPKLPSGEEITRLLEEAKIKASKEYTPKGGGLKLPPSYRREQFKEIMKRLEKIEERLDSLEKNKNG